MRKYIAIFASLGCSLALAGDYFTGQAARAVIGQHTFTDQIPGPSQFLLGAASGISYANGILAVVDDNRLQATPENARVLIFRDLANQLPSPTAELPPNFDVRCPVCVQGADVVLGQADFNSSNVGTSNTLFNQPTAVATNGTMIAVSDTNNNRVLIWNSIPTANNTPGQGRMIAPPEPRPCAT